MESDLNLKDTELRLGLPGSGQALLSTVDSRGSKRTSSDATSDDAELSQSLIVDSSPATKTQVVGWPPIRAYRRNFFHQQGDQTKEGETQESVGGGGGMGMMTTTMMYVKVSMDGAPYLRKIDIKGYKGYQDLLKALEGMFKFTIGEYSEREGYIGSEYVPTYEDKDGDWMLVGDVPWEMFMSSCKRLRIMKGSEAKGLACNM